MPFVSEAQRKKCYVLYTKDVKAGRKPKWDCKQWEKDSVIIKTKPMIKSKTTKSKTTKSKTTKSKTTKSKTTKSKMTLSKK
jgi:hypothetical protein